ncbi:glycine/D-amino acid oxidase-like deaminating enzyme [Kitasatospora sp. MAP12-15]|uniref:NAD(P)/FAD-dependent oxidoreductase n=1 Tax=unclassified Kitasatospora TaxID=2633591 RepID=UPI002473306D|nr:FAD-binding oxidoreductase [Kitasatospora sp. MAP12-44]MDH6111744.1 glycine/D-amino acid oxidase-like deaminating enzyme [Kitasatospora sp. MAP12-44]
MRVVVVGAGAIGSCVALCLAERGASVFLVDAQQPGSGLSAHGFGWVNAVDNGFDPYFALSAEGLRAHDRLAARTEGPPWFFRHGNLHWADTAEGAAQLAATADGYRAKDYPVQEVDAERAQRELQPGLSLRGLCGPLVYYPADAHVVADRFVAAVQERCRRSGVLVRTGDAVTGLLGADPVRGVTLASGERIEADAVVSCAGRGTRELLGRVGADVPLVEPGDPAVTTLGLLVRTSPVPVRVERILHAPHLSIRPHSGGRLVLHCHDVDEELLPDQPDAAEQARAAGQRVLRRLAEVLPGAAAGEVVVEDAYVGVRPMPADGMSVLGWVPGTGALYVVVTHSGLTLAPVLGELAAQELLGEPSALAAAFRPERFAAAP